MPSPLLLPIGNVVLLFWTVPGLAKLEGAVSLFLRSRNFYLRPLRGGRPTARPMRSAHHDFYPTLLTEGDLYRCDLRPHKRDFYPRPRVEGDSGCGGLSWRLWDFYLRPHTEGDQKKKSSAVFRRISSHTLRIEGDRWASSGVISPGSFLPTPSARRATYGA